MMAVGEHLQEVDAVRKLETVVPNHQRSFDEHAVERVDVQQAVA